jgi:large subunit ribosomal protein L15
MSDVLSRLSPPRGARRRPKRVGCGVGSRLGKTCGRGQKGQKARHSGNINKLHFEGGQTPMQRRLPKRGFRVPFPVCTAQVDVSQLERFDAGATVDEAALRQARLVQGHRAVRVKILGNGELTKALQVTAHGFSKAAAEKIEKAGGTVTVIEYRRLGSERSAASASERASAPQSAR